MRFSIFLPVFLCGQGNAPPVKPVRGGCECARRGCALAWSRHEAASLCPDWPGRSPQHRTLGWQSPGLHVPKEAARQAAPPNWEWGCRQGRWEETDKKRSPQGLPGLPCSAFVPELPPSSGKGRGSVQAVGDAPGQCEQAGGPGSSERVEGHWGPCLTSSVLKGVRVKGQGPPATACSQPQV